MVCVLMIGPFLLLVGSCVFWPRDSSFRGNPSEYTEYCLERFCMIARNSFRVHDLPLRAHVNPF